VILGADCTHWNDVRERFCGKRAFYFRRAGNPPLVVHVLCADHARAGDEPIPHGAARAAPATWARHLRYLEDPTVKTGWLRPNTPARPRRG